MLGQGFEVRLRRITLVLVEAILRIALVQASICASRSTLARIEAALISATRASPLTMAVAGMLICGQRLPSMNTCCGATASCSTACFIASRVACRMLMRSISAASMLITLQAMACSRICSASCFTALGAEFFGIGQASRWACRYRVSRRRRPRCPPAVRGRLRQRPPASRLPRVVHPEISIFIPVESLLLLSLLFRTYHLTVS